MNLINRTHLTKHHTANSPKPILVFGLIAIVFALAAQTQWAAEKPASTQSAPQPGTAIARLYQRLTPVGRQRLGAPLEALKPEGYELREAFLKPDNP